MRSFVAACALLLSLSAAALPMPAAAGSESAPDLGAACVPGPVKVFYYSLEDLFLNQMSSSLQDQSALMDVSILQFDARKSKERQLSQILSAIDLANQCTPILVNPVDETSSDEIISRAAKRNVPLIFFNRFPEGSAFASYSRAWYVGSDSVESGVNQAEIVIEYLKNHPETDRDLDGVLNAVQIRGEAGRQDVLYREKGFVTALRRVGYEINVMDFIYADWIQSIAEHRFPFLLKRAGLENIELIVSANDAMALGALTALRAQGYNVPDDDSGKFIPLVGIDALPAAVFEVNRGCMIGTVYNDYAATANIMIQLARSFTEGLEVSRRTLGFEPPEDRVINVPFVKIMPDAGSSAVCGKAGSDD